LGRDALRKLHGVEFSAKAVKQSITFPCWGRGTAPGVPQRELESVGGSRIAVDEANELQQIKIEANNLPPFPLIIFKKIPIFSNFYVSFFIFIRLISRGHEAS